MKYSACGWPCIDRWITNRLGEGQIVIPWGQAWTISGVVLNPTVGQRALVIQAEHLLMAERFEDAAKSYEAAGRWKEAGDARRRTRQHVVTQVHVNINELVEQLRRMGLSANYTCPVCRSPFTITGQTGPDALSKCQYCGAVIRPTDMVEALSKVVGYR